MPRTPLPRGAALALALAAAFTACGSDGVEPAAQPVGSTVPQVAQPTFDGVQTVPLSTSEHDRLLGASFDSQNRLYGAGFVGSGADQQMAVARFRPDGRLDDSFGRAGVATVNVAQGGKAAELARGIVVQPNGKVVISGTIEHDPAATGDAGRDTDVALARFDEVGVLDTTFGSQGVVKLDLSTGVADGTSFRGDLAWGLTGLADGKLLVVGGQVGPGDGREDLDFAVVRLTADGARDASFGTDGVAVVGVGPNISESPKNAVQLPDGKVVVTGYANVAGVVKVVLFRLTPEGALDPSFGTAGISVAQLLGSVAESYAVARVGNRLVTTGYGRDVPDAKVDLITGAFGENGTLDTSFGSNGTVRVDVAGDDDRGRNLVGLPNGGALLVGSGKPSASNLDALVVKLTAAGTPDAGFGRDGRRLFDIGGPNDAFFGVALSPDGSRVAVVGYLGRDTAGTEKDDSAVLWLRP